MSKTPVAEGFTAGPLFYDQKRYPRGFNKYGEFTSAEAHLLHTYGRHCSQLEKGEKKPGNKQEKDFVAVLRGSQAPQTPMEKAWVKYLEKLNKRPKVINPFGSSSAGDEDDDMSDGGDDVEDEDLD
jgi:uncharacterized protein YifE (UPF0438 family)